ncbi:DUF3987 domain-containing protein [Thiorhodococcus minor]|uniref:DUF3987 domain-containing protein n=1 Tax=Thiorhodococcus minor TaxID=57489 RepID=A0A6M0JS06_9GAMM|nr:DUF3987 domain-containing protein [Thiorhodococcus minor]NEV60318.1 DUF3987 domain-containing protein [Thiorhodococcus minor]
MTLTSHSSEPTPRAGQGADVMAAGVAFQRPCAQTLALRADPSDPVLDVAFVRAANQPIARAGRLRWSVLARRLATVQIGPKDGPAWLPAAIAPGPRNAQRVAAISALVLDIEARTRLDGTTGVKTVIGPEPPSLESLAAELELHGWRAMLQTSYSHLDATIQPSDQPHPRYHVVLALSRPLTRAELRPLGLHVAMLLGLSACLDTQCLEPARLYYLPRCPPQRQADFRHHLLAGELLPVDSLLAQARQITAACAQVGHTDPGPQTRSVIDAFNAAHPLAELLHQYGYLPKGAARWLHPASTSGVPGVRLLPDTTPERVYSSHAQDPLNTGQAHDAFSVYCLLAHQGDMTAAVRAAARALGLAARPNSAVSATARPAPTGPSTCASGEGDPGLDKAALRRRAQQRLAPDLSLGVEYPIDALGPLADTCRALVAGLQVRPALAGQSLLGTAALLTQSIANVRTLEAVKPLSLYLLTIGESGDGKSAVDSVAQAAIQARQRSETRAYRAELEAMAQSTSSDSPTTPPREPYRIARDGTVEGLRRSFLQGVPSQGVFTAEAAALLAGYGMSRDNRAKTAATFNSLWDDGEVSVARGTAGRIQLYDRRLSLHWMLQPEAAQDTLLDPLLAGIGFWPRFLLAWPEPALPRRAQHWRADQDPVVGDYWRACNRLLDQPLGEDCGGLSVLEPTQEALTLAGAFFERMEQLAKGSGAKLRDIKSFAVRLTEQAFRIAAVLTVFGQRQATRLEVEPLRQGMALASYALETWRGVFGERDVQDAREGALKLYSWLLEQPSARAHERAMLRIGPKALRSETRRDTALATLEQARLVYRDGSQWGVIIRPDEEEGGA